LNDYLVVPATAIIYAVSVTGGFFTPVDGTLLWVKPEARMQHVRINSQEVQAGFLRGPISAMGGGPSYPAGGAGMGMGGNTILGCGGGNTILGCGGGNTILGCGGGGTFMGNC
jgi:hypothetical protein